MDPMFRYFLGFQVPADRAGWLARQLPPVAGDLFAGLKPQLYHLTLCTIAETMEPQPFLRGLVVKAFETGLPAASAIPFGRMVSRGAGAELVTAGSIGAIRQTYEAIVVRLATQGIDPMHRKSGLRPHITLGYGKCGFDPVPVAWHWAPRDLVLIESHIGHRRHRVLQSWSLEAPEQGSFAFMADELPAPMLRAA
jgi:2'-5' RNA ligase